MVWVSGYGLVVCTVHIQQMLQSLMPWSIFRVCLFGNVTIVKLIKYTVLLAYL